MLNVSDYYSFLYKSKVTFVYSISNFVHPLRKILGKKEYIFIESLGIMFLRQNVVFPPFDFIIYQF